VSVSSYVLGFPNAAKGASVKYVYVLESLDSEHFYVGITDDLRARLAKHNAGEVPHTSKYGPWRVRTYVAFSDPALAMAFEKYLKSGSGRGLREEAFLNPLPSLPHHRIQSIA
jgi:putative endonuclease